jgi:torulene dioxygenase
VNLVTGEATAVRRESKILMSPENVNLVTGEATAVRRESKILMSPENVNLVTGEATAVIRESKILMSPEATAVRRESKNLMVVTGEATAVRRESKILMSPEILTKESGGLEFPAINPRFQGKKYDFFWATGANSVMKYENCLCKTSVKDKKTICWKDDNCTIPGEPKFVPNPKSDAEDDGVILSTVSTTKANSDFVVVLDAKTMKELGRVEFKTPIPQAIHGLFLENHKQNLNF